MKKTQEPEWNHEVEISMMSKQPGEVKIEVFNKKTLGKDELLGFVLLPTKDLLQPPHLINSWFKLEGAKSGQVFVAGGYIPAELPRKEAAEKVAKVDLDSDLATALTKQQQKIDEDTTVDRSQHVPKMSVQTIKIDDDLQSALKKQQRKIDVDEEKEKHISNAINNDLNPEWNFKESLLIDSNSSEK